MPNFRNIDEIIAGLSKTEQVLVNRLRLLISECVPKAEERFYPDTEMIFYRHRKLICFISKAKTGIALGFNQGYLMENDEGILLKEGRKQVYVTYLRNDFNEDQIRALLFEAAIIDEKKRPSKH